MQDLANMVDATSFSSQSFAIFFCDQKSMWSGVIMMVDHTLSIRQAASLALPYVICRAERNTSSNLSFGPAEATRRTALLCNPIKC